MKKHTDFVGILWFSLLKKRIFASFFFKIPTQNIFHMIPKCVSACFSMKKLNLLVLQKSIFMILNFINFSFLDFFFKKYVFIQKSKTSSESPDRERSFGGTFIMWTSLVRKLWSFHHARRQIWGSSRIFRSARDIYLSGKIAKTKNWPFVPSLDFGTS